MPNEEETRAREVLASQYRLIGDDLNATKIEAGIYVCEEVDIAIAAMLAFAANGGSGGTPIPMILYCPQCHEQHVDEPDERTPDWDNPPHRSHLCHACGCIWRPADAATEGVRSIKTAGERDTWGWDGTSTKTLSPAPAGREAIAPPAVLVEPNDDDKRTATAILLSLNPINPDPALAARLVAVYRAACLEADRLALAPSQGEGE
jgi:hypothetical protein